MLFRRCFETPKPKSADLSEKRWNAPAANRVFYTLCREFISSEDQKIVPTGCVFCGLQTDVGITLVSLETYLQCQSLFLNPWCQIRLLQPRAAGAVA